jgi:hypothetical protein
MTVFKLSMAEDKNGHIKIGLLSFLESRLLLLQSQNETHLENPSNCNRLTLKSPLMLILNFPMT